MAKKSTSAAVARLIGLAAQKTGWSIARLNRHLGKGENTLHRWRSGKMENFELAAIVELCNLAEVGMDETFGVQRRGDKQVEAEYPATVDTGLAQRVAKLEAEIESIKPLMLIADGISALGVRQPASNMVEAGASLPDVSSLTNSKILKAIDDAQQQAAAIRARSEDIEPELEQKQRA